MQFDLVTFLFELVNFVVLALVLQRFVYRPIAASIQERRQEIATARAEAATKLAEVDQRATALDARELETDRLRETIVAEATAAAASERARLLEQARADAHAERARVQALLEAEREAALGWVREVTVEQGVEVAGKLLLELVPEAAHEALVQRLFAALADARPAHEAPGEVASAEATFARVPSQEQVREIKRVLEAACGGPVRVVVATDEALGAGATVRLHDRVFDASVSGQLELLRDEARRHMEASA